MLNFDLIDLTSFWNVWFWMIMVVSWSMTAHWTLGVPFDALVNAERKGGVFAEQCESLAYINAQRIVYYFDKAGVYILGFVMFVLSGIGTAGFFFDQEFFQALFVLLAPLLLPNFFAVRLAYRMKDQQPQGAALRKMLARRRMWNQVIGLVAIILATMAGIYNYVQHYSFGS